LFNHKVQNFKDMINQYQQFVPTLQPKR